ncbi:MAG TPA: helix-turn-helix domain-containing protein, partial [Candidatus Thermoplasmatota archaeon]
FLRKHAQRTGKRIDRIDEDAVAALRSHDWPGNVRELENTIERAVVLCGQPVIDLRGISLLGGSAPAPSLPSAALHQNVEWAERETIRRALEASGGVKTDAAALMGISQRALSHYLAKHRID